VPPIPSLLVVGAWLVLGLAFTGIGMLVRRACRAPVVSADDRLLAFWLGWTTTLIALQLWHLVLPVDVRALTAVGLIGLASLASSGLRAWILLTRGAWRRPLTVVAFTAAAVWLGERALGGPQHGDTGAYFLPTVRWIAEYPIVPGLGNLFGLLAFNQSYFLYVALVDAGPLAHRATHVANGVLVLALLARALLALSRLLDRRRSTTAPELFHACLLPAAVWLAFDVNLTSPNPDLAVLVLGAVLSGALVSFVTRPVPRPAPDADLVAIALLAAGGLTVKLSFAAFAATVPLVAVTVWILREHPRARSVAVTLVVMVCGAALALLPWAARGIVLSGYPAYPSNAGGLPLPWRVPRDEVEVIARIIRVSDRMPDWWRSALRNPRWFMRWLTSFGWDQRDVLVPLAIAAGTLPIAFARRLLHSRAAGAQRLTLAILVPALGAIALCLSIAPRPRFAGAAYWVLAASGVALSTEGAGAPWRAMVAAAAVGLAALPFFDGRPVLRHLRQFEVAASGAVTEARLASGLRVGVPQRGTCWDAPLPCAPGPHPGLRLRREGDLGAGFLIDPNVPGHGWRP
jgi:hypothetical protein